MNKYVNGLKVLTQQLFQSKSKQCVANGYLNIRYQYVLILKAVQKIVYHPYMYIILFINKEKLSVVSQINPFVVNLTTGLVLNRCNLKHR